MEILAANMVYRKAVMKIGLLFLFVKYSDNKEEHVECLAPNRRGKDCSCLHIQCPNNNSQIIDIDVTSGKHVSSCNNITCFGKTPDLIMNTNKCFRNSECNIPFPNMKMITHTSVPGKHENNTECCFHEEPDFLKADATCANVEDIIDICESTRELPNTRNRREKRKQKGQTPKTRIKRRKRKQTNQKKDKGKKRENRRRKENKKNKQKCQKKKKQKKQNKGCPANMESLKPKNEEEPKKRSGVIRSHPEYPWYYDTWNSCGGKNITLSKWCLVVGVKFLDICESDSLVLRTKRQDPMNLVVGDDNKVFTFDIEDEFIEFTFNVSSETNGCPGFIICFADVEASEEINSAKDVCDQFTKKAMITEIGPNTKGCETNNSIASCCCNANCRDCSKRMRLE